MKSLIFILLFFVAFISSTQDSNQKTFSEKEDEAEISKTYTLLHPSCKWTRSIKVTKIENDVFQCVQVDKPVTINYKSVTTAKDSYQLMVFDEEEYSKFLQNKEFKCINEPQCHITDNSVKVGTYPINRESKTQDFFVVIKNKNFIERAFVDVVIEIE